MKMESHIEKFTEHYFDPPSPVKTCIPLNTPFTKPHLLFPFLHLPTFPPPPFPPSLLQNPPSLKVHFWLSRVNSPPSFFLSLHLLRNHSRVICVSAGAGHEVMALQNIGVTDVTAVELVDTLPLVRRADPYNLPFFDGVFDIGFTMRLTEALYPLRLAGEMERTLRKGGICVGVVVEECGTQQLQEVVRLFRGSTLFSAHNVTLLGRKMTAILLKLNLASSS